MSDLSGEKSSLPEEFRVPLVRFSFFRVFCLSLFMSVVALIVWRLLYNPGGDYLQVSQDLSNLERTSGERGPPRDESTKAIPQIEPVPDASSSAGVGGQASARDSALNYSPMKLDIFSSKEFLKLEKETERKRAFVGGAIVNIRESPGGKIVGQLLNGEEVAILDWPRGASFVKILTQFGLTAYVGAELLTFERFRGVFSSDDKGPSPFDSVIVESYGGRSDPEFSREYENFRSLLDGLPIKQAFDYKKSNLKYVLVSSSSVVYPSDPTTILSLIRSVSSKPSVFFERLKRPNSGPLDPELEVKAVVPVRRLFESGAAKSTRFEKFLISEGCPKKRIAAVTEDGTSSQLELLVFDIKKKTEARLSVKPHRGNPSFTWAYADLNGDTWQDVAFYFGGESAFAPFRYLFVAHNIDGAWRLHRVADYSGVFDSCAAAI